MDEKKADHLKSVPPSLTAAIRRARIEGAEQNQAVADLRETEIARLQLLEEAVRPVIDQAHLGGRPGRRVEDAEAHEARRGGAPGVDPLLAGHVDAQIISQVGWHWQRRRFAVLGVAGGYDHTRGIA